MVAVVVPANIVALVYAVCASVRHYDVLQNLPRELVERSSAFAFAFVWAHCVAPRSFIALWHHCLEA